MLKVTVMLSSECRRENTIRHPENNQRMLQGLFAVGHFVERPPVCLGLFYLARLRHMSKAVGVL